MDPREKRQNKKDKADRNIYSAKHVRVKVFHTQK